MEDKERFNVHAEKNIDDQINRLRSEFDSSLQEYNEKMSERKRRKEDELEARRAEIRKRKEEENTQPEAAEKGVPTEQPAVAPSPSYSYDYSAPAEEKAVVRPWLYAGIGGAVILLVLVLAFVPVIRFSTPLREDRDLPQIQYGFKYFCNIFGKKMKEETIFMVGNKKIILPMTVNQWLDLDEAAKLHLVKQYQAN